MHPLISIPATLYPNRVRTVLLLLGSAVLVVGSALIVRHGDATGYFCGGFFVLCMLVFGLQLHPRATYLHLTTEGFTYGSLFRAYSVRWTDVREFGVIVIHRRGLVAWNFVPGNERAGKMRRFNQAFSGYEAALPNTYGIKAQELADGLNHLLQRVTDVNPSTHRLP